MSGKIGFAGIGVMGEPMTRRLLAAGLEVAVWNRNPAKLDRLVADGAVAAASPAQLARTSDIVMLCLLDTAAVEAVVFGPEGIASGIKRGAVLVDFSSIRPDATRDFAQHLADAAGASWVDAPVSGGVPGAEQGTLAIMAGGEAASVERVRPVVAHLSARFTHMGPSGAGQTTKLCNQIIVGCAIAAISEATRLAEAAGVDAARLPECLAGGFADSRPFQIFQPRMVARDFDPKLGQAHTLVKDLDTAMDVARAMKIPLPMAASAGEKYRALVGRGGGGLNPAALIALYDGKIG